MFNVISEHIPRHGNTKQQQDRFPVGSLGIIHLSVMVMYQLCIEWAGLPFYQQKNHFKSVKQQISETLKKN